MTIPAICQDSAGNKGLYTPRLSIGPSHRPVGTTTNGVEHQDDAAAPTIALLTSRAASGNSAILYSDVYAGANAGSGLVLRGRSARGTRGAGDYLDNNDTMARFAGTAWGGSDFNGSESARVRIVADGDHGSGNAPGKVVIETGLGQATPTIRLTVDALGNIFPGTAGLATTATDGFIYMQSCAGTPTGVPTSYANRLPFIYNRTDNLFHVYNGGWKTVALTA